MSGLAVAGTGRRGRSDDDLVASVREGDERAFEAIYARYAPAIAGFVRRRVRDHGRTEDVTQEVFLAALRRMRQTARPIALRPWLFEIARNACIDLHRRRGRVEELSWPAGGAGAEVPEAETPASARTPEAALDSRESLRDLCGAMGGLTETQRRVLVLRELEGLSYRAIAERTGLTRPAVESTLFRARRRLSEEYEELVTGERCRRVQQIVSAAAEGLLGTRERRRLVRHLSHCQACRRHARSLGLESLAQERTAISSRLAGLFPLLPRPGRGRTDAGEAAGPGGNLSSALAATAEPAAAVWQKGAVALGALAIAGAGAHVAERGLPERFDLGGRAAPARLERSMPPAPATPSRARPGPAGGLSSRPAGAAPRPPSDRPLPASSAPPGDAPAAAAQPSPGPGPVTAQPGSPAAQPGAPPAVAPPAPPAPAPVAPPAVTAPQAPQPPAAPAPSSLPNPEVPAAPDADELPRPPEADVSGSGAADAPDLGDDALGRGD